MNRSSSIISIVAYITAAASIHASTINITGHVLNVGGAGISGATVALARQHLSALTAADGSFTLSNASSVRSNSNAPVQFRGTLPYRMGNSIVLATTTEDLVGVRVVELSGKAVASYSVRLPAGTYRVSPLSLLKGALPAAGIYFATISTAGTSATFGFIGANAGGRMPAIAATNASAGKAAASPGLGKSLGVAVDTLTASLSGYDTTRLAIDSLAGMYSLTLAKPGELPSKVANLQMVQQGGTNNATAPISNSQELNWAAATAGTYLVSHYKNYRNGSAYDTTSGTSYTDKAATNSNIVDMGGPATSYAYTVSAVDTHENEGPQATASAYLFNGKSNTSQCDLSFSGVIANFLDAGASPTPGPYDTKLTYTWGGGFQPCTAPPISQGDAGFHNNLEIGGFKYLVFDVKYADTHYVPPTGPLLTWIVTMTPPGDVFPYKSVAVTPYLKSPASPAVGVWCHYKIPFVDLNVGTGTFTGSINGATLTVTSTLSGAGVEASGYITGPGVPAGTYTTGHNQNSSIGTFPIAGPGISGSTHVAGETMDFRRTAFYKLAIVWSQDDSSMIYLNNLGFTAE